MCGAENNVFTTNEENYRAHKSKVELHATSGMIGVFGLAVELCVSPLTAQKEAQDLNAGEITCTGLVVVRPDNSRAVASDAYKYGGYVSVYGEDYMKGPKVGITLENMADPYVCLISTESYAQEWMLMDMEGAWIYSERVTTLPVRRWAWMNTGTVRCPHGIKTGIV